MNMNMNIANARVSVAQAAGTATRSLERVLERMRMENAGLQRDLASARAKTSGALEQKALSEGQLTLVKQELAAARKTIADLEAQVKSVTASVEAQVRRTSSARKEKADKTEQ